MKRLLLGVAAVAAVVTTAAPASGHVTVEECYATVVIPCGVCVSEGPVNECVMLRG